MPLSANNARAYELGTINELPVKAAARIFEGAAVGVEAATGFARPIATTDAFGGFAESEANNTGGVNGAINARVRTQGLVELDVTGVVITSYGAKVYAVDDGSFTLTASTNVYIGRVHRYIANGRAVVAFSVPAAQVA